jgi:hypothetical protein
VFGGWSLPDDLDLSFDGVRGSSTVDIDLSVELDDGFMAGMRLAPSSMNGCEARWNCRAIGMT